MATPLLETCMLIDMGLNRSECASWIQAWGSILAIAGAVGAVVLAHFIQRRSKQADDRASYNRDLEYSFQLANGAAQVASKIKSFVGPGGLGALDGQAMLVEVTAYCDAFGKFDASKMGTAALFRAVLACDALTRLLKGQVEKLLEQGLARPVVLPNVNTKAALYLDVVREAREKAKLEVFDQLERDLKSHAETIAVTLRERHVTPRSTELIESTIITALRAVREHL